MNLLEEFKNYLFSQEVKPSKVTVKNYLSDVNHFIRWFELTFQKNFTPQDVTNHLIENYKLQSSQSLSSISLERHLSSLRKFFKFLKLKGLISRSPFDLIALSPEALAKADPYKLKDFKSYLYVFNASHLTIKNYLIDIKQFLRWAQEVTASNAAAANVLGYIDSNLVEEYKQRLLTQGNFSPSSINRKLSSLRKYIAWATEEKLLLNYDLGFKNYEIEKKPELQQFNNGTIQQLTENKETESQPRTMNQEPRVKTYSPFPPLRLFQKITKGINLAIDATLIAQLVKIIEKTEVLAWKLKGQPIFTGIKNMNLKSSIINHKSIFEIKNFKKELYAPLEVSTKNFSWYKKTWFNLRYKRPKWYKTYHSYAITHYFHFAVLVIFAAGLAFGFYNSFFQVKSPTLAANPNLPTNPARVLSFQGRLTDNSDNPITSGTNLRFQIYRDSAASGAAVLLWQEVQRVNPDTDGIFNALLGNTATVCSNPLSVATGACSIPQSLFSENNGLWLGVTVENTSELTPRQQIATVAFAANSETLQGLLPITATAAATNNVVLALNSSGNLVIGGSATPVFQATGGQFTITGQTVLLSSGAGSNGNIQIAPDGTGRIDLTKPLQNTSLSNNISSAIGSVEVDDSFAILASQSGQSALTINETGGATSPLISASASGIAKFTVDNNGNISAAGGLTLGANTTLDTVSAGTLSIGTTTQNGLTIGRTSTANTTIQGANFVNGGVLYGLSGAISQTSAGTLNNCLIGQGSGSAPIFSTCPQNTIDTFWNQNLGALFPNNSTADFLFGSQASVSARFKLTANILGAGTLGVASISGKTSFASLVVNNDGVGDLFTASASGWTRFKVANSGAITSAAYTNNGGILYTTTSGLFSQTSVGSLNECLKSAGGGTPTWGACGTGGGGNSPFQELLGAIVPNNSTEDLLVGGQASSSAIFALLNVNPGSGNNPDLRIYDSSGHSNYLSLSTSATETFIKAGTGTINIGQGGGTLYVQTDIQNDSTNNLGAIKVTGRLNVLPSATNNVNSNAALIVNNPGTGDILTASGAGTTRFTISNAGAIGITSGYGSLGDCLKSGGGSGSVNTWATCGSGGSGSPFQELLGAIVPNNSTEDFLIGGQSTASAKFGILNIAKNQPLATISGQLSVYPQNGWGGNATISADLVIGAVANPVIQTTRNQLLTIGGNTTGNITLSPNNGTAGLVSISGSSLFTTGTGLTTIGGNLTVNGATTTFNNAAATITTGTNQTLTINPNGLGVLNLNTSGTGATNIGTTTNTGAVSIGNTTGAMTLASAGTSSWTNTAGALTIQTATSGTLTIDSAGSLSLGTTNQTGLTVGRSGANTTINGANTGAGLTIGPTAWTATPTISGLVTGTSGFSVAAGQSYTGAGAVTLSSGGGGALTLDSASNTLTIAATDTTLTASGLATVSLGTNATINAGATALNLQADGTPDVNIAGGSGSTGCTILNASGNLTCTGNITSTSGIVGFWQRLAGNLSPATTNDTVSATSSASTVATFTTNNPAGTLTNNTLIQQTGSGTVTNLLNITQSGAGAATNGLTFAGTFTKLINSTNFNVTNAGGVTAVGVDSGSGLLQGTGGLTVTGAVSINDNATTNTTSIGGGTTTGQITIGGTGTQTLVIGVGAGNKTVQLGSNNTTSTTTILSGSGGLTLNNNAGTATTGIGIGTTTGQITIGGTGTQTLAIGNGAGVKTVQLGSSNTTSTTTILSGSGGLTLNGSGTGTTTIGNGSGTVTLTLGSDARGDIFYRNSGGTISRLPIGTASQCLIGGLDPSYGSCLFSDPYWNQTSAGVLFPNNSTVDFLFGSQASVSARFKLTANILGAGTLGVASISGKTSFASLVVNNDGVGDLFTASSSGTNKFAVQRNGLLLVPTYNTAGGILFTTSTGLFSQTTAGSGGQCLQSAGGGTPTWGTCGTGGGGGNSPFQELLGAIVPNNSTEDLLVGGQATTSAIFSFTNVNSGTPTFKVWDSTGHNNFLSLAATATTTSITANVGTINIGQGGGTLYVQTDIQNDSTNNLGAIKVTGRLNVLPSATNNVNSNAALIVNNPGTGDILTASGAGTTRFTISNAGAIGITSGYGSLGDCLKSGGGSGSVNTWATCGSGGSGSPFQELLGAIVPNNSTEDFLIGSQATTSALFSYTGVSSLTHQTKASISGQLVISPNFGYGGNITTVNNYPLNVVTNGTGALTLDTGGAGIVNLGNTATTVNISTGTTNDTVNIVTGATGTNSLSIGTGASAVNTINIGTANSTSTTSLLSGSGGINLNAATNQPTNINTGSSTGTVTIGGTGTQTLAIGNGAGIKTVQLGSSTTSSTTTILSGSGGLSLNANNSQPTNINTGSSTGLVSIGGGSGTVAINTTNWGVTSAGAISGLTGYSQSSGNFAISGAGTFGTGTGTISLNGSTTIATTKILTLTDITGNNRVLYSDTGGVVTGVTATSTANQCLLSGSGAAAPSWQSCPAGAQYWQRIANNLSPATTNDTVSATSSAATVATFTTNSPSTNLTQNTLIQNTGAGALTNLLTLSRTAGTVTNGLNISGTITNDINLQNSETINNSTDNTINLGFGAANGILQITSATSGNLTFSTAGNIKTTGALTLQPTGNIVLAPTTTNDVTFNPIAGQQLLITQTTSVPTTDMVAITNLGLGTTTAGANGLSIFYVGGNANIEASGQRIDLTPGGTSGGIWNGLRIAANSTGPGSGVTENLLKIEGPTSTTGTTNGIQIGVGTQAFTNAINIASTGVSNDIILHNGNTINNSAAGTIVINPSTLTASSLATFTTNATLAMTSTTTLTLGSTATINANATSLNLQADGTPDVNIAGGSGLTGCTITNSNGNISCSGTFTSNGVLLANYWQRNSGTVEPINITDDLLIGGISTASASFIATGKNKFAGTTYGAYVQLKTSYAAFLVDNQGNGELISASASGVTQFKLSNSGRIDTRSYYDLDNPLYFLDPAATATSLDVLGGIAVGTTSPLSQTGLHINKNTLGNTAVIINQLGAGDLITGSASGTTNFLVKNNGDVVVGNGGGGKLTVTTVDPLYTIDGTRYSTYAPSMTGVKEEVTGKATLTYNPSYRSYSYKISLNNQETGSDLWLFSRVTDTDVNLTSILLTPDSSAKVWYEKDATTRSITFFADRPTSLSFRLTAPRFDHDNWQNLSNETDPNINGLIAPPAPDSNSTLATSLEQSSSSAMFIGDPSGFKIETASGSATPSYILVDNFSNIIKIFQSFSDILVANIQAGFIGAQQISTNALSIATENVTIGGQNLKDYIASIVTNIINSTNNTVVSPVASIDTLNTNIISPIGSESKIALKLEKDKLSILNGNSSSSSAVASFDNQGNATLSGILVAKGIQSSELNVLNDATISGTLHAGKILATDIIGLDIKSSTISANYITNNYYSSTPSSNFIASNPFPTLSASTSGANPDTLNTSNYISVAPFASELAYVRDLNADYATFNQGLMVFGPTSLSDTSIVGQLSVNGSLILADNSINVLGSDLNLQPLRQGGLSIMAGLIYIDTNGNATFNKDVTVKGTLYANTISPIQGSDLAINLGTSSALANPSLKINNASGSAILAINQAGDLISSGAATFGKLNLQGLIAPALAVSPTEIVATGSAGTGVINAGRTQMTIDNKLVTNKSLIYITPTSSINQTLFLLRQVPGTSFTVGVQNPSLTPIQFNWIIVN